MVNIDTSAVMALWAAKEARDGKRITAREVWRETHINLQTIHRIRAGKLKSYDSDVLSRFCAFFDVPPGPVPFLVYTPDQKSS